MLLPCTSRSRTTTISSTTIQNVLAREVLDSRGNPTIEADVFCAGGAVGRAITPSGASTGEHEAVELRDADHRYAGKGALKAVANVRDVIGPAIVGLDARDQEQIDQILIDLDGTPNKAHLGANALLAVSLAVASSAAAQLELPLFRYLGGPAARTLPVPCLNVLNGGVHASNPLDIQEFLIVPAGLNTFSEALRAGTEVYHALKQVLSKRGLSTNVGDEGGVAPDVRTDREALGLLMEAIELAGYEAGEEVALALDIAASELYEDGVYSMGGARMTSDDLSTYLQGLVNEFPLVSIEDAMDQDDWVGWKDVTDSLGGRLQLLGDDVFATNEERLKHGIDEGAGNAILIKVNQIGTLSETLHTIQVAERASFGRMISHRSGETEDTFISHLAVATNAGQIKAGAPARGERTAKYNELLRIEEALGDVARFAGWDAFSR